MGGKEARTKCREPCGSHLILWAEKWEIKSSKFEMWLQGEFLKQPYIFFSKFYYFFLFLFFLRGQSGHERETGRQGDIVFC